MPGQGGTHSRPAIAPIGVDLVENGHLLSADLDELIHQAARLLVIGGAQIENEFVIRRLALRFGAAEGEKKKEGVVAMPLQERQAARRRGRAHVIEEQKYLIGVDEASGVFDRRSGVVTIIVRLDGDLTAMDAAQAVDMLEIGHGAAIKLDAQAFAGPGKGRGHAQNNVVSTALAVKGPLKVRRIRSARTLHGNMVIIGPIRGDFRCHGADRR